MMNKLITIAIPFLFLMLIFIYWTDYHSRLAVTGAQNDTVLQKNSINTSTIKKVGEREFKLVGVALSLFPCDQSSRKCDFIDDDTKSSVVINQAESMAVISVRNSKSLTMYEKIYSVGNKLPSSINVSLVKINRYSVILNIGGSYRRIDMTKRKSPLEKSFWLWVSNIIRGGLIIDNTSVNNDLYALLNSENSTESESRKSNGKNLFDVLRVHPAIDKNGNLIGFKLRSGNNKIKFYSSGFKKGDILVSINNDSVRVTEAEKLGPLSDYLRANSSGSFKILRGDEYILIEIKKEIL